MKGNPKIISTLNDLLADELMAISQYMVHSEMCSNWGYLKLHKTVEKRAIDEMKHAEHLISRILFLEGTPVISHPKMIRVGAGVTEQINNDLESEQEAVKMYNDAIRQAVELGDNGTRELLVANLKDEESHLDWLETHRDLISQLGASNYLAEQLNEK